jgi:hypothetical protein
MGRRVFKIKKYTPFVLFNKRQLAF